MTYLSNNFTCTNNLPAHVLLPMLVSHREVMTVWGGIVLDAGQIGDIRVELDADVELALVVAHVAQVVVCVGEHLLRVVPEEQTFVVAQQRVPVVAQVELLVRLARMPLVQAY